MRALRVEHRTPRLDPRSPDPTPGPGEALVRTVLGALGAADLAVIDGRVDFSGVMGHRFVGVVERVHEHAGEPERARWVGKRVVGSISVVCGQCERCKQGLSAHCSARAVLGLSGRDGCLAERFTLPIANLCELPKSVDDESAVFAEPLAGVLHAAQMLRIQGKPYVTVLGDGPTGLLAAQVLTRLNASVRLLGLHERKLALCERWGVKHRHVNDVGRRQDQDVVVDCTGSPDGLRVAMQLVRPRGKILLRTTPAPVRDVRSDASRGVDLSPAVVHELEILGARCGRVSEAVGALSRGEVDVLSMISARCGLDDGPSALKLAAQPDQLAVLVRV